VAAPRKTTQFLLRSRHPSPDRVEMDVVSHRHRITQFLRIDRNGLVAALKQPHQTVSSSAETIAMPSEKTALAAARRLEIS